MAKFPNAPDYMAAQSYPVIKVLALAKEEQNWIILLSTNFLILIMIMIIFICLKKKKKIFILF